MEKITNHCTTYVTHESIPEPFNLFLEDFCRTLNVEHKLQISPEDATILFNEIFPARWRWLEYYRSTYIGFVNELHDTVRRNGCAIRCDLHLNMDYIMFMVGLLRWMRVENLLLSIGRRLDSLEWSLE